MIFSMCFVEDFFFFPSSYPCAFYAACWHHAMVSAGDVASANSSQIAWQSREWLARAPMQSRVVRASQANKSHQRVGRATPAIHAQRDLIDR